MTFIKVPENFTCGHCGFQVTGNGYTNHCPRCLWSKHVDVDPGDRAAACGGLMEPISYDLEHGRYVLIHRCTRCGHEKRNKFTEDDSVDALAGLLKPLA